MILGNRRSLMGNMSFLFVVLIPATSRICIGFCRILIVSRDMHCTMAKFFRYFKDFHGPWQLSQENPGFSPLGSQDSHHHDDTHVFPIHSTWLAIENGRGHISLHKALGQENDIWKFAPNSFNGMDQKVLHV